MWLVVGGKVTNNLVDILTSYTGERFQGVNHVLDVAETVLKKGVNHFSGVSGIIVLTEGCHSVVDLSWMATLNLIKKPVLYYSNYAGVKPNLEGTGLNNISVKEPTDKLKIREIAQDIQDVISTQHQKEEQELVTNTTSNIQTEGV